MGLPHSVRAREPSAPQASILPLEEPQTIPYDAVDPHAPPHFTYSSTQKVADAVESVFQVLLLSCSSMSTFFYKIPFYIPVSLGALPFLFRRSNIEQKKILHLSAVVSTFFAVRRVGHLFFHPSRNRIDLLGPVDMLLGLGIGVATMAYSILHISYPLMREKRRIYRSVHLVVTSAFLTIGLTIGSMFHEKVLQSVCVAGGLSMSKFLTDNINDILYRNFFSSDPKPITY